jgi:uncharacterized protein YjbJ (UPF0337 family)
LNCQGGAYIQNSSSRVIHRRAKFNYRIFDAEYFATLNSRFGDLSRPRAVQHSDEFSSKAFRPEIIFSATRTELYALITCSAGTTRCYQFVRRPIMSSTTDKIKGMANEAAGAVKQSAGKAVGNPNLEVKGTLQKGKGEAQQAVGKAKDAVKKVIDKA